jgi:hypothetical protein
MEQLATPGSMHLTAETLRLAEGLIQITSLGPVPEPSPSRRGYKAPSHLYAAKSFSDTLSNTVCCTAGGNAAMPLARQVSISGA